MNTVVLLLNHIVNGFIFTHLFSFIKAGILQLETMLKQNDTIISFFSDIASVYYMFYLLSG